MSLFKFSSFSVSRLACFASSRLSAKFHGAAVARSPLNSRPSIRLMSTPQFQSSVGVRRHAVMTRNIIKDAIDQQVQNRPASSTPDQRWQDRSKRALESAARTPPADAYSGRTVHVKAMGDLAVAYRQLDGILNRNRVRATLRMTERHEKPGVKRRRLSSQRWRKRFADEVRKKVQLVMKIRDRGA